MIPSKLINDSLVKTMGFILTKDEARITENLEDFLAKEFNEIYIEAKLEAFDEIIAIYGQYAKVSPVFDAIKGSKEVFEIQSGRKSA